MYSCIISITDGSEQVKTICLYSPQQTQEEVERMLASHYTDEREVWRLVRYGNLFALRETPDACNYFSDYLSVDPKSTHPNDEGVVMEEGLDYLPREMTIEQMKQLICINTIERPHLWSRYRLHLMGEYIEIPHPGVAYVFDSGEWTKIWSNGEISWGGLKNLKA